MGLAEDRDRLIADRSEYERRKSEFIELQASLRKTDVRLRSMMRNGKIRRTEGGYETVGNDAGALIALLLRQQMQLVTARADLARRKARIDAAAQQFAAAAQAQDVMNLFSSEVPFLLLPVRMETKFMREQSQLWVRIYPDEIAIQAHEPGLTEDEQLAGRRYLELLNGIHVPAAGDARKAAWREIAGRFGAERAAWIVRETTRAEEGGAVKQKPESWSEAPRAYIIPDSFTVRLYRPDGTVVEKRGEPIPEPLPVGPAPFPVDEQAGTQRLFDEESAWMVDFDKAVACGMGLRINIDPGDFDNGFTRVIVAGIKTSANSAKGARLLTGLINSHRHSKGFSFVAQGTPTNNTSQVRSGLSSGDPGCEESYETENVDQQLNVPFEKDGFRAARALGIEREDPDRFDSDHIFLHTPNAGGAEFEEIKPVMQSLWPVTLDYFLENMLSEATFVGATQPTYKNPVFARNELDMLRQHFMSFVRGRGPYPAFRVGNMPYGIFPTTAFTRWEDCDADSDWIPDGAQDPSREEDRNLNRVVVQKLKQLYPYWREMAADPELVPRVGGTMDPEKEFVQMLSMNAGTASCHIRPVVHEFFLWNAIQYIGTEQFFEISSRFADAEALLLQWWAEKQRGTDASERILTELGMEIREFVEPVILKAFPWGLGYEWNKPFVGDDFAEYLEFLKNEEYNELIKTEGSTSDSLLYNLLRLSIQIYEKKKFGPYVPIDGSLRLWVTQSLDEMRQAETLRPGTLERAFKEVLDLCTHRFDAWVTSFVTKRLESMRRHRQNGVYIGAFGWVEDLKPSSVESAGYIHAPSLSQAYTGAVLRSAYLSHASRNKADLMSVNLTSDRARLAAWLLDGIRQGQPLGALLGYRFERNLHERYTEDGLEMDQYIFPFRKLYPLKAGKVVPVQPGEAVEAVAAANVVDGQKLLQAWDDKLIPFGGPDSGLPGEGTNAYRALQVELQALKEVMDSVGDVALSESVHQCVLGNYDRSGVMMDALAGNAQAPEAEVIKTPRGGFNLKHRVAVLFTGEHGNAAAWGGATVTPRSQAEPLLNAWAAGILGDPERIRFGVSYRQEPLGAEARVEGAEEVTLNQLLTYAPQSIMHEGGGNAGPFALSALDVLSLAAFPAGNGAGEFEQRAAYYIRDKYRLRTDSVITCSFARQERWPADVRSLAETIELAGCMQTVLGHSRFLEPSDLFLPEEAEGSLASGFTAQDYDNLSGRYNFAVELVGQVKAGLSQAIDTVSRELAGGGAGEDSVRNLRGSLFRAAQAGCRGAVPAGAVTESAAGVKNLLAQAGSALKEIASKERDLADCGRRLQENAAVIEDLQRAPEGKEGELNDARGKGIRILIEAIRVVFGKSFTVLPGFVPQNRVELDRALDPSMTDVLLDGQDQLDPLLWLQQAAYTHSRLKKLEDMMMYAGALAGNAQFPLNVAQLPFKEQDRWLALPLNSDREELEQGTLSMVSHMPFGFSADGGFSGLVIDEWDEQIPHEKEDTGVSFHFNRPSNQAPQAVLLAVPPRRVEGGKWTWNDLISILEETFDLAKMRGVDLDAIKKLGAFLPAVFATMMPDREILERREP